MRFIKKNKRGLEFKDNNVGTKSLIETYICKEDFYCQAKSFFEDGLLREIYSSDKISVCNVANAFYTMFNYSVSEMGVIGVHLEPKYLEGIMKNNDLFYLICKSLGRSGLQKYSFCFDKQAYNYLKTVKQQIDILGPAVDLEYEKKLLEEFKKQS